MYDPSLDALLNFGAEDLEPFGHLDVKYSIGESIVDGLARV